MVEQIPVADAEKSKHQGEAKKQCSPGGMISELIPS